MAGLFIHIKTSWLMWDDLGVQLFWETAICLQRFSCGFGRDSRPFFVEKTWHCESQLDEFFSEAWMLAQHAVPLHWTVQCISMRSKLDTMKWQFCLLDHWWKCGLLYFFKPEQVWALPQHVKIKGSLVMADSAESGQVLLIFRLMKARHW